MTDFSDEETDLSDEEEENQSVSSTAAKIKPKDHAKLTWLES